MFPPLQQGAYSVQQSQFQSPPVLYSQSQPMLVTNQNNMNYQMVNLGAGAMLQKMQQREQEEKLIDLLTRQNELINELADDFNWRMQQREQERLEELEELERKQILLKQKKAEQEYIYKINRQLNHGLEKIKKQQMSRIKYPGKPFSLGVKVPSIIRLEKLEQIYPNPKYAKDKIRFKDAEIQAEIQDYQNPYAPYPQYEQDYYPPQLYQTPQIVANKKVQSKESRRSASNYINDVSYQKTQNTQNDISNDNKSMKKLTSQFSQASKGQKDSQQSKRSQQSKKSKTNKSPLQPVNEDPNDDNQNDDQNKDQVQDQNKDQQNQGYDSDDKDDDYYDDDDDK